MRRIKSKVSPGAGKVCSSHLLGCSAPGRRATRAARAARASRQRDLCLSVEWRVQVMVFTYLTLVGRLYEVLLVGRKVIGTIRVTLLRRKDFWYSWSAMWNNKDTSPSHKLGFDDQHT